MSLIGFVALCLAVAFAFGFALMLALGHGLLAVLLCLGGGGVVGAVLLEARS